MKTISRPTKRYIVAKQRLSIQNGETRWAYPENKPDMPEFPLISKLYILA
jgi:hypothetical protein